MKKIIISIAILAVLAIGSLTAFMIVHNNQQKKDKAAAEKAADYVLFNFNSDNINSIKFTLDDGDYTAVLVDGEWQLDNSDEFLLRQVYVQGVCTYMSDLTAVKDYGELTDDNKTMYGLDKPTVITASDGSQEYTLNVGCLDPTETYYYVTTSEKSKVYAISSDDGEMLKADRQLLKDRYIVPYTSEEVNEIQLIRDGETIFDFTYDHNSCTWNLPDEYSAFTIDQTKISTLITYLVRTESQEMFEENLQDLSKYGFDKPAAEVVIKGTDGKTHKLLFSYYGNNTRTYTHVLFEESGQVAAVHSGDVEFINNNIENYLVSDLCSLSIYDASKLEFTYNGNKDVFNIDIDNSSVDMNGKSITELGGDAFTAFQNFYNSISYMSFKTVDIKASPDTSEPIMSALLEKEDGDNILLELYPADNDTYYAFINGSYTGALVDKAKVTGKNSVAEFYNELIKVTSGS